MSIKLVTYTLLYACVSTVLCRICVPPLSCPSLLDANFFQDGTFFSSVESCLLIDGSEGVLCESTDGDQLGSRFGSGSSGSGASSSAIFFPGQSRPAAVSSQPEVLVQPLTNKLVRDEAFIVSDNQQEADILNVVDSRIQALEDLEDDLSRIGRNELRSGPAVLQQRFQQPQESSILSSGQLKKAQRHTLALQELQQRGNLKRITDTDRNLVQASGIGTRFQFPTVVRPADDVQLQIPGCSIPAEIRCDDDASRIRSHNGQCNNQPQPNRGRAMSAFSRLFPARYGDQIWKPVVRGVDGDSLPSPRLVSAAVVDTSPRQDPVRTLSVMQFGQFINHDMISTMGHPASASGGIFCCHRNNTLPRQPLHPEVCLAIEVPRDDPFYSRFGQTCMNQVRSARAPFEDCVAGPVKQLNQVSQFLDASNVYGSSKEAADRLRSFNNGQLKTSDGNLLPEVNGRFISGEVRLSENPGLTFMHTVWTREHNRVAEDLKSHNQDWTDEDLYQQARRIVIAEYQHIVYNELLPAILGPRFTRKHGLNPEFGHSSSRYSADIDPRISSEFSTAAFRFGHSQIQDSFVLRSETGRIMRTLALEKTFFQTGLLKESGFMGEMARSLTRQKPRSVDTTFSASVHERLFSGGGDNQPGLDLVALNINRGRDHGLPGYITALENCLGSPVEDWAALGRIIDPVPLKRLKSVYKTVEDIDLYIGGISEKAVPGSLVGPTFQCIIGDQFFNTRYGDRFYYDNADHPGSLRSDQVLEIQQTSWARVLCDNIPELKVVQPLTFWQPSFFFNRLRSCKSHSIPAVDLSVF